MKDKLYSAMFLDIIWCKIITSHLSWKVNFITRFLLVENIYKTFKKYFLKKRPKVCTCE
jgi:hypothetical protein